MGNDRCLKANSLEFKILWETYDWKADVFTDDPHFSLPGGADPSKPVAYNISSDSPLQAGPGPPCRLVRFSNIFIAYSLQPGVVTDFGPFRASGFIAVHGEIQGLLHLERKHVRPSLSPKNQS